MQIRKRINKRIEHDKDGVQVAAAVNAVVSANVGEGGAETKASSRQRVVQREGRTVVEPEEWESSGPATERPDVEDERAQELPDREGTYDELRDAAAQVQEANEGESDE